MILLHFCDKKSNLMSPTMCGCYLLTIFDDILPHIKLFGAYFVCFFDADGMSRNTYRGLVSEVRACQFKILCYQLRCRSEKNICGNIKFWIYRYCYINTTDTKFCVTVQSPITRNYRPTCRHAHA